MSLRLYGASAGTSNNNADLAASTGGQLNMNGTQYYNYSLGINNNYTKNNKYVILYVKFGNNFTNYNYTTPINICLGSILFNPHFQAKYPSAICASLIVWFGPKQMKSPILPVNPLLKSIDPKHILIGVV